MSDRFSQRGPDVIASNDLPDIDELLTVDDLARLLKVNRSWVYEHVRNRGRPDRDRLPHIKIGKYIRFEMKTVREYLHRKSQGRPR